MSHPLTGLSEFLWKLMSRDVHHLVVVAGLDHVMKDMNRDITADDVGHPATVVPEPPVEKKEWRLPRNSLDKELAERLVAKAKTDGVSLVGPDGLLSPSGR